MLYRFLILILAILSLPASLEAAPFRDYDDISATIFAYNRIGEDHDSQNNLRLDQFESHIQELIDGDYHVKALTDVISAFQSNTPLPKNTVVLTFDGGYRSILNNAIPLLEDNDLPYTLFIPSNLMSVANQQYLNWTDLKSISKSDLATIGIHPAAYTSLRGSDKTIIQRNINTALGDFQKHLGERPKLFAYPFGDYDDAYADIIGDYAFDATLGLQSGVAYYAHDLSALPRFNMTERYGDLSRFRMAAQALPFPVKDIDPHTPALQTNPPSIGFTVHSDFANKVDGLSCFASNGDKPILEKLGDNRLELRLKEPFIRDRGRVNCTLAAGKNDDGETIFRWFGLLFTTD
ncbi:MAG: polysaccharide deacetylase family protein [Pseudomonadota bacterium]